MVAHDLERSDERVTHGSSNSTSHHPLVAAARAGPATPTSPIPSTLTPGQIADALAKSPDNGATLDLTHLGLTDVGESGAEELASIGREQGVDEESPLVRVALGFNRLATLPMTFALLSRVRYLNLRNNSFSVFPDVLTVMPSLEILDIRRNKLKRFPSQPGSLVNLRVLSMSRNKITRLPTYFSTLHHLETLGIDHNSIEWPPKAIMEPYPDLSDAQRMKDWILNIQTWMEGHTTASDGRKLSDDSVDSHEWEFPSRRPRKSSRLKETSFELIDTPHARSFSIDSEASGYFERSNGSPSPMRRDGSRETGSRPPPLFLGILRRESNSPSPSRSPDSYLPTPDDSVASTDEETTTSRPLSQIHMRGPSYAQSSLRDDSRGALANKQSLPDLRMAKFSFGAGHRNERGIRPRTQTDLPIIPRAKQPEYSPVGSLSPRQNGILAGSARPLATPRSTVRSPDVGTERNSYFRRLSTISSSTIHTSIPQSLLTLIEGVRDIMFAVTQIYDTCEYYALHAADPTLASVLKKVLDPSSLYIARVIESLDRFDSTSRRAVPAPAVCRAVVSSCRDMVAGFGKAVEMLSTQLKVIAMHEDKRYTRQMLLVLYGSTAEVSRAWTNIARSLSTVRAYLIDHHRAPPHAKSHITATTSTDSPGAFEPPLSAPATSSPFATGVSTIPFSRSRSSLGNVVDIHGNSRRAARRNAGSFSVKDVELGRTMPSVAESPPLPTLLTSPPMSAQTPTPRAQVPPSLSRASPPTWGGAPRERRESTSSIHRKGSSSSITALSSTANSPPVSSRHHGTEPTVSTLADKDAIDAVAAAVEAAPSVWDMMEEIVDDLQAQPDEVREALARAKSVTARLRSRLALVQAGESAHRAAMREDAQVFVKIVVQLSNTMKTYSGTRISPAVVRARMVRLTNATEACLMLLHVSSFSVASTPTPRSHSPLVPPSSADGDSSRNSFLSRSRSATAQATTPRMAPAWREAPRSALPHQQTFRLISPTRAK